VDVFWDTVYICDKRDHITMQKLRSSWTRSWLNLSVNLCTNSTIKMIWRQYFSDYLHWNWSTDTRSTTVTTERHEWRLTGPLVIRLLVTSTDSGQPSGQAAGTWCMDTRRSYSDIAHCGDLLPAVSRQSLSYFSYQ